MIQNSAHPPPLPIVLALLWMMLTGLVGCASGPQTTSLYDLTAAPGDELAQRHAPLFVMPSAERPFNRIGTPRITVKEGKHPRQVVDVDPQQATMYVQQQPFETERGRYLNLIYRVHFSRVPLHFGTGTISAGRNGGLLVVVTLDEDRHPVLVTTVHTCGCYLAFLPTSLLPRSAYPDRWDTTRQRVWGETLPGQLVVSEQASVRPVLWLRPNSHRVTDARMVAGGAALLEQLQTRQPPPDRVPLRLAPMAQLRTLPAGKGSASFFYQNGWRKGYVKGAFKPLEAVFASWWALDLLVGNDKQYGPVEQTGTRFYTSLKPWRRSASNMWPFDQFLTYWGWHL